ncbi:MAG: histidine kinase [Fibrobacteria bacterium]|jgi:PAS domain S-box-containing protein|nr:histidine kinase [Fibrobacteria bacterium]
MNARDELSEKMRAMNEALLLGSLRQHELAEAAENLNAQLRMEIAEREQIQAALRETEGRFRTLFELGPAAIQTCDASGAIRDFNRRAVELWGREPVPGGEERFCGSFKLFRPDGRPMGHEQCPMAKVISGETPAVTDGEVLIERPDGSRISVIVNIKPLKNERGEITGAINCFYDITGRKLEEEVRRRLEVLGASNRKLEQEIVHREAVEETLRKSEKHQKQVQERMKQLAHQVLHAQEEERLRISRDLHDQIAQTLIGINVRLALLTKGTEVPGPDFRRQLRLTQRLVKKSVEIVAQFSHDLRPTLLDDLGLIPTLHTFLKRFMRDTGIRASLVVFAEVEKLDHNLLTVLYRVAQEALNNVIRHAKANAVEINIQKVSGQIYMTIKDNGEGFKTDTLHKAKGKRLGLVGMQERLEMIGGTFDIRCADGRGTTVTAKIPLAD